MTEFRLPLQVETRTNRARFRRRLDFGEPQEQVKQIRAMFNVDMIGNLHIHRESRSDSQLTDLIFRDAQDLGYGRYFLERPLSVEDDQMPFVRAGIPAVELISLDYGPFNIFWHTPFDTVGKCSAVSLGIVGRVLLDALNDLESGRTPKPLLAFLESGAAGTPASRSPLPSRSSVRPVVLPHRSTRRYSYARPDSCSRRRRVVVSFGNPLAAELLRMREIYLVPRSCLDVLL